jgi:hypothetical protein
LEPPDYQGVAAAAGRPPAARAGTVGREAVRAWRGIAGGLRARCGVFLAVAASVLALQVLLPPAVLSLARGRADYFTFNPWLAGLPRYLFAADVSWPRKLDFLPGLALFWFSADSPYGGTGWGFTVTASDLARFMLMALLFGGYFALLTHYRHRAETGSRDPGLGRKGGAVGAFATALVFAAVALGVITLAWVAGRK